MEVESRVEAPAAVLLVIALQLLVALLSLVNEWSVWMFPWWAWLIPIGPELALIAPLALGLPDHRRRWVAIALVTVTNLVNAWTLTVLIGSIVSGREHSGGQLLLKGLTVWTTNVVSFGLGFWVFDGGGPLKRRRGPTRRRDFQFPTETIDKAWQPHLVDYAYLSFTNSIAFSPTDAMPLTRPAKLLMMVEASVSAIAILLVAARAVNIFK